MHQAVKGEWQKGEEKEMGNEDETEEKGERKGLKK